MTSGSMLAHVTYAVERTIIACTADDRFASFVKWEGVLLRDDNVFQSSDPLCKFVFKDTDALVDSSCVIVAVACVRPCK